MKAIFKALIFSVCLMMVSPIASLAAPSTAPLKGDMAVTVNAGVTKAIDDEFEGLEPVLTGTFGYYSSPRVSWRALLGVTSFDADGPGNVDVDVKFLTANVLYNWEGNRIHPYVTGGIGVYDKNASRALGTRFDETVFGLNGGGGIDWFLGSRWALEFEGTLHGMTGENPNIALLGTAGLKFWF